MAAQGIFEGIRAVSAHVQDPEKRPIVISRDLAFYNPGYWSVVGAAIVGNIVDATKVQVQGELQKYTNDIGFADILTPAIGAADPKIGEGLWFSRLTRLDSTGVDQATSRVNACLRAFLKDAVPRPFITRLNFIVGEMHDNVRAHAQTSGCSMGQRWKAFRTHEYFEFAVADCGFGFQGELARVGIKLTEREAIGWCLESGNTTKGKQRDEWAQSVPEDHFGGNPYGPRVPFGPGGNANHHQGLGLAKLREFAVQFRGDVKIVSGSAALHVKRDGTEQYLSLPNSWKGVAISCRFQLSKLVDVPSESFTSTFVERVSNVLTGE